MDLQKRAALIRENYAKSWIELNERLRQEYLQEEKFISAEEFEFRNQILEEYLYLLDTRENQQLHSEIDNSEC